MMNNINQQVRYEEDEIDLRELFRTIWKNKFFIGIFVFIITILSILFVLSKPNEYKVYTILAPQEQTKSLGGLGALASMAGVNIGANAGITPDIAFKNLLTNYPFMKSFIKKHHYDECILNNKLEKDYIFAMNNDSIYKFFHSNNKENKEEDKNKISFFKDIYTPLEKRFSISTDKQTGLITISFISPSREFAYNILNTFLVDATNFLVNKNLEEIDIKINKYQKELTHTNNLELKTELAKLISNLIKQKVYINSSKYYKVKVISEAYIPDVKDKAKPKRALIVIVAFIASFIFSIFLVFFIEFIRDTKNSSTKKE